MATRLPYYTGEGDIYSQLMAQFAQEQPYYSAAPFGAGFTGGYDPTLYMRTAPRAVTSDYSGLLGGAYLGGDASLAPANPVATDMNSVTGGLLASLIGGNTMAAVDSVGGNAANLGPANLGLDIGLMGQAGIADAAAAMDASQAMGQGMVGMDMGAAADAAAAADAGIAAADGVGASGIGDGGGGGGGGKIICTKLHQLGKMPTEIYEADQAFGAILVAQDPQAYYGYACWAQHVVRWMSRDDLFGKFAVFAAYHIATPWSKAMAQDMGVNVKSSWFGRFLMKQGLQLCRAIGEMNQDRSIQNV